MRSFVLRREVGLLPELRGGVPGPSRVVQHATAESHEVGVAIRENTLRLLRLGDEAHGDRRNTGFAPHSVGQRYLIPWADRDVLLRHAAARRCADVVAASRL